MTSTTEAATISKAAAVLAVLADGPATTAEVQMALEEDYQMALSSHLTGTHLRNLFERRKIDSKVIQRRATDPIRGRKSIRLWALPGQLPKDGAR